MRLTGRPTYESEPVDDDGGEVSVGSEGALLTLHWCSAARLDTCMLAAVRSEPPRGSAGRRPTPVGQSGRS